MTDSPFMTTAEVARFARCSVKTVERAWATYRRSNGGAGLRATQRGGAYSALLFLPEDVTRWTNGEAPLSSVRKLRRAS